MSNVDYQNKVYPELVSVNWNKTLIQSFQFAHYMSRHVVFYI